MKVAEYSSPKVKVIENFISKETCDFIIDYCNKINLWEKHNQKREDFGTDPSGQQMWDNYSITWKDRVIDLDRLYKFDKDNYFDFISFGIKLQRDMHKEVKDFFNPFEEIYLENWAAVRWGPPYQSHQPPHIDFLPADFDPKKLEEYGFIEYDRGREKLTDPEFLNGFGKRFIAKHFTSMLYLNDDFDGGELYFPQHNDFTIKPRPGLLVIFSGDINHWHGINPVTNGIRHVYTAFWSRFLDHSTQIARDEKAGKIDQRLYI